MLKARLRRLEREAGRKPTDPEQRPAWLSEDEWLSLFDGLGRQGYLAGEPDFPAALTAYRDAVDRAAARTDWHPPHSYLPSLPDSLRLLNWRSSSRFPEMDTAWEYLAEMVHRVENRIPPVSDSEFHALADWFETNAVRLVKTSGQLLALGRGREISTANVRYGIRQGARSSGAGELAETLRQLKSRYGSEDAEPPA